VLSECLLVLSCGWDGNRGFGAALSTHHRLKWFIHLYELKTQ